jgi:hypothetical protein
VSMIQAASLIKENKGTDALGFQAPAAILIY